MNRHPSRQGTKDIEGEEHLERLRGNVFTPERWSQEVPHFAQFMTHEASNLAYQLAVPIDGARQYLRVALHDFPQRVKAWASSRGDGCHADYARLFLKQEKQLEVARRDGLQVNGHAVNPIWLSFIGAVFHVPDLRNVLPRKQHALVECI
jgi:hypothetical protein